MAKYLTDLADVLRKAGLEVVEVPGWKTRGRPGSFNPTRVLCHHTAGWGDGLADATAMATRGRPDLSPPLAQLALSRKGAWYVLAAGRANHAGQCKAIGGLKAYPGASHGDGNAQMLGVEAQNRGTNEEDWSPTQYAAYVRGVAALTKHYGWAPPFGHKETSTSGKVDPDFDMDKFRRDVAAIGTPTTAPQENDMPTPAEVFKADVIAAPNPSESNPTWSAETYLRAIYRNSVAAFQNAAAARSIAEAQAAKGGVLTAEEIEAAAQKGAKAALDEKIADATTILGVKP